jgi:hypothetical protein
VTTDRCATNRSLRLRVCAGLAAVGIAISAAPVWAVDGVIQINQAKALAGAVTAGDAPGFPVTISEPGSYRLTSDLTVPNSNTNAVSITADGVTLDLNGFSIAGPTTCTYSNPDVTCGGTEGTGTGVVAATSRVSVLNGRVRGMGSNAIELGALGRVEDVDVVSNGGAGITLGTAGIAQRNRVSLNLGSGITAGDGARVTENRVLYNEGSGISTAVSAAVTGNISAINDQHGIVATSDATIVGNISFVNEVTGVSVTSGGVVDSNLIYGGGSDSTLVVGDAVNVRHNAVSQEGGGGAGLAAIELNGSGNTLIGNMVVAEGTGYYGIDFNGSDNSYVHNVITTEAGFAEDISGSGVELGENFCCTEPPGDCAGSTTCPWPGP